MISLQLAWSRAACAVGAALVLIFPAAHGADVKKRVQTTYAAKPAVKTSTKASAKATAKPKPATRTTVRKPAGVGGDKLDIGADGLPMIRSAAALVVGLDDGRTIYAKNTQSVTPIASITKLMTAMVVLDADLPLNETIYISSADLDSVKHTNSRLAVGSGLTRGEMLRLALMSSENRAASSLGRAYPGGSPAFVAAMNRKAIELGMWNTRFVETTGLSSENVSTAEDLVKLVNGAYQYPLIREYTTTAEHAVETSTGRILQFRNSNGLVNNAGWEIGLSKTGYISEAGRCLVMQARIAARPVVIVLLDSWGRHTRAADANRIKKWLETHLGHKSGMG